MRDIPSIEEKRDSSVLAIVDFEATCCDKHSFPRHQMEIIEIGAVAVDAATGDVLSEFGTFIRPTRNPILTGFCTTLTTITQNEVDAAPTFAEALATFSAWLRQIVHPGPPPTFCSWGDYDRKQLTNDCEFHKQPFPFSKNGHRNLKLEFSEAIGSTKRFGLGQALDRLGLNFEGTPHRGIDDAKNIARVYKEIFIQRGRKNA